MSKPLALTQRQVKALCEGAKRAGFAPVVQFGDVLVRLIPKEDAIPSDGKAVDDDEDFRL